MPVHPAHQLTATALELAQPQPDPAAHLLQACLQICRVLGAAAACGLLAPHAARPAVTAGTTPHAHHLAKADLKTQRGPASDCLRAQHHQPAAHLDHPLARLRWPTWSRRAQEHGFTAATGLVLHHRGAGLGAITVLSAEPQPPDPVQRAAAELLAQAAAAGLHAQQQLHAALERCRQLEGALSSRVLIEQAKGIVAERLRITPDAAFLLLRGHARSRRQPLRELAHSIIAGTPFPASPA
ncbi:ANTAR domain-containing protein [Mangrovactinospora gilvigrisea]|nr:ANTAR domain-containing protein [Mangrovactinospora gilvigrisea]